jgi:hypothetical protein
MALRTALAWYHPWRKDEQPSAFPLRQKYRMNTRNWRALPLAVLALALLGGGCYDFHLTGPEDPPSPNPPRLVAVTIEYRQPLGCVNSETNCDDQVVFFASWMRPGDEFPLVRDPGGLIWRGVARGVPVNFPPRDSPHAVRVYDPHLRDQPNEGLTAERLRVGGEALTVISSRGTIEESGLVFIDENGQGRNPF